MAGAYEACNHVFPTLYKIEYANNKRWCSPSCTETACHWNQSTKKDIEPNRITELFVHKSLRTKQEYTCATSREETRMKHLLEFDPITESHKEFCQKDFESFLEKFKKINQRAVIFKSFETDTADQTEISFMDVNIQEICHNIISNNPNATESELTTILFQKLSQMTKTFDLIEYNTRDQSNSNLWFDMRKGCFTASRHHDIYTKVNTIAWSQGAVKSKTTRLVEAILFPEKPSVTNAAIKWGN